jgi:hypothetical protein
MPLVCAASRTARYEDARMREVDLLQLAQIASTCSNRQRFLNIAARVKSKWRWSADELKIDILRRLLDVRQAALAKLKSWDRARRLPAFRFHIVTKRISLALDLRLPPVQGMG